MRHWVAALVLGLVVITAGCAGLVTDPRALQQVPQSGGPTATPAATTTAEAPSNGTVEIHYINVGQADATLVVGPANETMLIDSGDWQDDGEHVLAYLERHNVTRINYLVTTHAHADHIGGHTAIIEHYETKADGIGAIYDPGIAASTATYDEYLDAVERHNVTLYEARAGDKIPFANASVELLSPPNPYLSNEDRDENSIAVHLTFGNATFLFTGDAGDAGEKYLVDTYGDALNATALQAGHHGSNTSSQPLFLDTVQPDVVVISSAYDSHYGHPHGEVLERLAARNLSTYWTATHGDVVLFSDGGNVTVYTQQAAPTNATALREGDPIAPENTTGVTKRATFTVDGDGQPTTPTPTTTDGGTPTPTPTDTPTDTPTATPAESQLTVEEIHEDAAGDDWENLNDEYVVFENDGEAALDLTGWQVQDEADHTYTFPDGFTLDLGETVTLYTGSGDDTATELYWGSGSPIWNNGGDTVIVVNADGDHVIEESY